MTTLQRPTRRQIAVGPASRVVPRLRDLRFPELRAAFERAYEIRQRKELATSIQSGGAGFNVKATA